MSLDPARFWRAVSNGATCGTAEDWSAWIGDAEDFPNGLFRAARRPVATMTCRTPCGYCCPRRIQRGDDGVAWAFCPEPEAGENAYPVPEEAMEQHELDPSALAALVAAAVAAQDGGERGRAEASRIDHLWQVAWTPTPTWLFLEPGHVRWTGALTRMLTEYPAPGRLLLPTGAMMEADLRNLFETRGWVVVALADWMEQDDAGAWQFTNTLPSTTVSAPGVAVGCASVPAQPADTERYAFRCRGATWDVTFEGDTFTINDTRGCHALAVLLEHPDQRFSPLDLEACMDGRFEPRGRALPVEMADRESRENVDARIEEIQSVLDGGGDPASLAELREEMEGLVKQQRAVQGLGGKGRTIKDEGEKARQRIGRNLRTTLAAIRAGNVDAGRHFVDFSPNAYVLQYVARDSVVWKVERIA